MKQIEDNMVSSSFNGEVISTFRLFKTQNQFASLGCQVHVVSFGTAEGAARWREDVDCKFPVWSDISRSLYKALGFKRSIYQVTS